MERNVKMKKYIVMTLIIAAAILAVPKVFSTVFGETFPAKTQEEFTLVLTERGETVTLSAEDYLTGCLFAQTDVSYHIEALKAQACAAYTYALRLSEDGAELSDSTSLCQPYFTPAKAKEYYGDSYEKYLPAVKEAAAYGAKHSIYYENKPIYSVYHSVSTGVTARPEYIWGRNFPYLSRVNCSADTGFSGFRSSIEMTADSIREKLIKYDPEMNMPLDYSLWFSDIKKDEYGYVMSAEVGGKTLSGGDLWRILGTRSTAFDISWTGMNFRVTAVGYGHGAGMSQYTANQMANEGKTAVEILEYFYEGARVK